ncbi:putative Ig domain-containing protein [Pedobacter sp. AW1-32]|uniref:Ig-like domain-containing protein n=1 Tax=Pedobacter sp. AW1-32 TaxID=3383026 RepID=UPI003FF02720
MMKTFTSRSLKRSLSNTYCAALIIVLTLLSSFSYAQTKVYATNATTTTPTHVANLGNAATTDDNTFATLSSSGGAALGLGAYTGDITLQFPTAVPANKTTYIRINSSQQLLNALLGGTLGGTLGNLLQGVALGAHQVAVGARNGTTDVLVNDGTTGFDNSSNNNGNGTIRLVKDKNGFTYVAITPTRTYDRVFVVDRTLALLLSTVNTTEVYYAFHIDGADNCDANVFANFDATGISLDALNLGSSETNNFQNLIDNDPTNFYNLSTGVVGVAASKTINIYYPNLSATADNINLRLRIPPAVANVGLLSNLTLRAFNGTAEVYSISGSSILGLDLLGLLNSGQVATIPIAPGVAFDRVSLTLSNLVSANVAQTLEVYGITRSSAFPTFVAPASNTVNICYNTTASLTATTASTNQLVWYDVSDGGTALATTAYNAAYQTAALTANKTYYVASRKIGCTSESVRVPVNVVVNPAIIFTGSTLTNATVASIYSKQLAVATGGTPGYTYTLASGSTLPAGLTLSTSGVLSGTPTVANTYTFSVLVTDTKGCTATAAYTITVTAALVLTPAALPEGTTGVVYPTQTIPAATGGTGPYTYFAQALPPGLSFDPVTRQITGTPTQVGNYTIPVTVTDANGNSITSNYTIKVVDPFLLPSATLANGTTGTVYTPQIIPSATGGSTPYTYSATGLPPGLTFNPTTRAITGTPTVAGPYTVAVTASDADGKTVTTNYAITINNPLVLPNTTLPSGTENVVYAAQTLPAATGGVGPYTYVASNLPAGITYDATTRQIAGTPTTAGNYSIGITVTDSQGATASNTYALRVAGTLSLPTQTLPNGVVNSTYTPVTLPAVSGGTAPYTYAATNLPPGIVFDPITRIISGTPTQGGTFNISVTARDANGNSATTIYPLTVTVTAPIVASVTVCSGSPATLTVNNRQDNITYNLYGSTGSTPIASNTTGVFTTPAATSSTVFYVEAVSGTAVSTKTSVNVSVNPPATLATVTTNSQTISSGQTATLTATADAGNTIAWFDAASGGTQVATGGSFTTPALTATTTYYIETTSSNGCKSATRVPVTVNVTPGGGAACNAASAQVSGINGVCLLCGITGAGNSTDADASNFTRINLAVGVGATGFQQLIFPTTGVATDSIRLDLGLPSGLADVGLLNNITVTVLNGTTVVRTVQISGSVLNLSLLGGNRFAATVVAGGAYTSVRVSFGAVVSALSSLDVYGATVVYPNPTITAGAQTVCSGVPATLSATANGGTTLTWFDAPTGGNQVGSGLTFTTPALTATTTYYIQVSKGTCSNVTRVPVTVTVNPAIVFNGATLTNATLASAYSRQLPVATGGTPAFTYAVAAGSALPAGLTMSASGLITGTPTATSNGSFSVVVTDSRNCTATAVFNLTVTPALALSPGALPDGVTGTPYTTNGIPAATGGTGPYTYSAIGLPPGLTFNPATREISGTPTQIGNYTIPVTVTDANGNTITSNFTIRVTDPLVLPAATLANGITGTVYTPQTIPSAVGGTTPYTYSATGLPPGLTFDPATRTISGTPTQSGPYNVTVTATDATGKTATNTYAILVVDPLTLPNATLPDGTEGTVYATQTLPSAVGGVGPYTYAATGIPAGLIFDPATRQVSGTPTQAGNYSITLTATDAENKTATNNYALRVIGVLTLPSATLPNGTVGVTYPTQTLPAVTGGTAPYTYLATGLPPGLNFNTATREITGTPTLGGTFAVSVTATDASGNKATTTYSITVNVSAPVVANATVCSGSTATLSVSNLQAGVTYNWYAATGSTPLATSNTGVFITPTVTSSTVFYVEAVSGTAVSSRTAVNVSVNPPATLATVTTNNQVISSGQTTTLQATADTGNTIAWFDAATAGNQVATGASFTTPALTATTTYYVETTNSNGCKSATRVPVTVTVLPNSGGPTCNAANAQNSGITGICLLCGITGAGNSTDADANNFTRITLAVGVGSTGFQQLIFPSAGSVEDSIRLDLALPGGLADVGLLSNVTVNVMNGATVVRTVQLNSSLLNLQLLSGNRFAATVAAGGIYDRVQISFGGVVSALTSLDVYGATVLYRNPTITAGNQTICSGSTASLAATATTGTSLTWYDAATGGNQVATGGTFTTPALTTTTTYYIEVSRANCPNPTRIPVTVTVTPALNTPVLATIPTVCSGSTATLSVANPDAAVTYRWYDAATSGNLLFTGSAFVTPALNANATYYVEAAQGNCVSATRTAATITVNPRPALPTVSANASTVNPGQTAIITASSADATNTFNWYATADATSPIFVGATYVTPPLLATTSYYVEAVSTNGCASSSRVQITITVDGNGSPNPVPCEAATTQTSGVTGIAVLGGVYNQTLAIDNDTQTASSLVIPVGLLNASVYQRVGFGSLSKVGDTVRVLVSAPGKLLSLDLLGSAQITTYAGSASNGDSRFLNNNTLNIQLLSGSSQALITYVPTAPFDGVEVRLNSGVVGALTSIDFNYAQRILVAPTVVSPNVTACVGSTALLQVSNPSSGLTYRWYDAAGAYQTGKDGITFTTPVLTGDTRFFVAAVSPTGCVSYRTAVNVTTSPAAVPPTLLSSNVTTCPNTAVTLQVSNPTAGNTYNWYESATSTDILFVGTSFTTPVITGARSYFVAAVNACGIESTRTEATITVGAIGVPILTPPAITITSGSVATLQATSNTAGAVITWYDAPTNGTLLFTGENFITPPLTTTTTYYVEANVPGGCTATSRASVTVTVVPNGGPVPTPCGAATIDAASGINGIVVAGGVFNTGLAVDNDINTGSSLVIPVGLLGSSVYHRVGFTALSSVGDTLRIKITNPAVLLSVALLQNLTVTTYQGTTSNGDAVSISNPLITLNLLGSANSAILTYVPTNRFDGVELRLNSGLLGALTSVNFDYAQRVITKPVVNSATASVCQGSSTNLSVQNPRTGVTYKWYLGTTYQTGKDGVTFATDPTLAAGTYTYSVTASFEGCETLGTDVVVTVLSPPAAPIPATTNPATTCINSPVTLSVQAVAGVTNNWYDAATGGNMLVNNNSSLTTSASLAPGIYNYYVEAVNATSCSNPARTLVSIIVLPPSVAVDITVAGATSICAPGVATLTASTTTVTDPVFTWYNDAALTSVAFTGASFTTPTLNATTTYYVTVSGSNKCANLPGTAASATIMVNPTATAADLSVSGTGTICSGNAVSLTATSTTVTNPVFMWYRDAARTDLAFTGATFNIASLTATTTFYVTVKGDNKCENAAADARTVTITVNPSATDADVSLSGLTTICRGSQTLLSASTATVINPVFNWYTDANLSTPPVFTGANFQTPVLNATTTYYVTVRGDNKCESTATPKSITVTVNEFATAADITVADAQICSGSSVLLTASSLTVTQPVFTWYNDASLTSVAFVGPIFNVSGLTATTTFYVTVKGANRCENAAADAKTVTVTVNPLATTTDIILSGGTEACAGSGTVLTATSPTVTNPVFTWYSDADLTNISFIGAVFTTPALNTTTTYYVTVKGDNKCENAKGTARVITITVKPVSTDADINVADATVCAGSGTTLVATSTTVTNPVFTWYSDATLTTFVFSGSSFNTGALSATTKYYVTVKGDNKCDNSALTAKVVTVTVNPSATAADITLTTPSVVCGTGAAVISASSTTVTAPVFTWYNDASLTSVAFVGPIFTTPTLTATTTYYVTVQGTNKCANGVADAKQVTIVVNPIAVAADIIVNSSTSICGGTAAVLTASSTTVTNPVFTWYTDAALTNVAFVGATFTTPVLNANATYYVTVKGDNKCENSAATAKSVNVVVNPVATADDVTATDATVCAGNTTILTATSTTVTNPIFTWYSDAQLTTPVHTGTSFTTPVLTATTTYYVTVKGDNRCESSAATARAVTVTVNPVATAADINLSTPPVICNTGTAVISASSTTVTAPVFTWYSDASLTSVAFVGPTFTTPTLTTTTTYYVTVKGTNRCENSAADAKQVTVIVNPIASATDVTVTGGTTTCANSTVTLTASSTTVTNPVFTWYSDASLSTVVFTGNVFITPALNANTTYYVTVRGDNRCESNAASAKVVAITVNPAPINPVVASVGTNICSGDATTLNISNAQTGVTYEWYNAAVAGNLLFTGTSFTTPVLTTNTTYYVLAVGTGGCNNAGGRVMVTVTVNARPQTPTVASSTVNVCTGNAAILSVTNAVGTATYNWYTTAMGGTPVGSGSTFTTPAVTANITYYVEAASGSCISTVRTALNVIALPVPVAPASATPDNGILCAGSTAVLTVNNPVTGLIYRWYDSNTSSTVLAEGITFRTPVLTSTRSYFVESVAVGGCASPTRTQVTITVLPILSAPIVAVQTTTSNSVTFAWPAVAGATAYEVSLDNGLTWIAPTNGPTGTSYTVIGLKPDQSVTLIARAKGQLDCQRSANSNPVVGKAQNPLGNEVYIPNAFTPNNDGKNDFFLIYGNTIQSARMNVYTQWGQLIFQSDNVTRGWDGTYKGVNQPIGVYVYMVEIQFNDGTSTMKKGTITLLR